LPFVQANSSWQIGAAGFWISQINPKIREISRTLSDGSELYIWIGESNQRIEAKFQKHGFIVRIGFPRSARDLAKSKETLISGKELSESCS
jgi:hypothetical protein